MRARAQEIFCANAQNSRACAITRTRKGRARARFAREPNYLRIQDRLHQNRLFTSLRHVNSTLLQSLRRQCLEEEISRDPMRLIYAPEVLHWWVSSNNFISDLIMRRLICLNLFVQSCTYHLRKLWPNLLSRPKIVAFWSASNNDSSELQLADGLYAIETAN